jgi:Cu-Zn family superoxide dismutase
MPLVAGGLLLFSTLAYGQAKAEAAKAELKNAKGEAVGNATLTEGPGGVKIAIQASKLPPGPHGFHIHAVGKCDPPDFTSAGGHFNPHGKKHGLKSPEGPHAGDLPNLVVGADGAAKAEVVAAQVTLKEGKNSLFQPGGTALVIHANPDDEKTDPTGNAGGRIACGVITK